MTETIAVFNLIQITILFRAFEDRQTRKKCFANDIEHFGRKALEMFSVKKCQLFEGVSPSFGILAEHLKGAQNVHGVSKIDFLRVHQE